MIAHGEKRASHRQDGVGNSILRNIKHNGLLFFAQAKAGHFDISCAILSSLFAIQTHLDNSLRLGLGQIPGASLGTAIGLTCIYCPGGVDETLLRVVIATGLTCGLAALWPEPGYSVAAAAVTALEPFPQLHIAIGHAAAIVVGSTIGVAVCFSVAADGSRPGRRIYRQCARRLPESIS